MRWLGGFGQGRGSFAAEGLERQDLRCFSLGAALTLHLPVDPPCRNVFRGLALLNLKKYDESEAAYRAAIDAQPSQMLAWQVSTLIFRLSKMRQTLTPYPEPVSMLSKHGNGKKGLEKFYTERKQWDKAANTIRSELDILLKA